MGGMITQALVINHPVAFLSACSIMSTTGDRSVGAPTGEAVTALLRPAADGREEAVAASLEGSKVISSPGFPFDVDLMTRRAEAAYDRALLPRGHGPAAGRDSRLSRPDRGSARRSKIPFLVIHGEEDPLVTVSGGKATAAAVPGSELILIPGMGHDLPEAVWDQIIDAIVANTAAGDGLTAGSLRAVLVGGQRRRSSAQEGTRPAGLRTAMSCPSSTPVRPHHDPTWSGWSKAKPPRRTRRASASGV